MPKIEALDRLKSQLLASGVQQKNQPLYQVINQLIDFLRQSINEVQGQIDEINNPPVTPVTNISNLPMPMALDFEPIEDLNPLGMMPGPQVTCCPKSTALGNFYWVPEEFEYKEVPSMVTLLNANSIPETAIADGTILARVAANENISGQWLFSNPVNSFEAASPQIIFKDTGGGVDMKYSRLIFTGNQIFLQLLDDAFGGATTVFHITRNGSQVNSFLLDSALSFTAQVAVTLASDQTAWNPTSLGFTVFYSITGTAAWVIRGITAQITGTVLILHNAGTFNIVIRREDGAASAANRITMQSAIAGITMTPGDSVMLFYSGLTSRWILISGF